MVVKCLIRDLRKEFDFTQTELGDLCGLSQNSISDIENLVTFPSVFHAFMIANALQCKVDDLYFFEEVEF